MIMMWIIIIGILLITIYSANAACQYASSAAASSQRLGSLASYATGAPNAKTDGCDIWSGKGYSWSPYTWDRIARLNLRFPSAMKASELTVYGDYDMCCGRIWLKNSKTGARKLIFDGEDNSCTYNKQLAGDFLADMVILETCGWSWSSTDAVRLCDNGGTPGPVCGNRVIESGEQCDDGNTASGDGCSSTCQKEGSSTGAKICDWYNCAAGAASVSVDDSFTTCRSQLNSHGWKGTFFLMETNQFTQSQWSTFRSIYNEGHEIGGHTQTHVCSGVTDNEFRWEISSNRNDILENIGMPQSQLVTLAWPCGFAQKKDILSSYYKFARGYFYNQLEDKNPSDFLELKSFNTPHYNQPSEEPPSYFSVADQAEAQGRWANLVFHNECSDSGAIDYLATKNLWVAPIGKVAKYIKERQSSSITNFNDRGSSIGFDLSVSTLHGQALTVEANIGSRTPSSVKVNGESKIFRKVGSNVRFSFVPRGNDHIDIVF